MMNPSKSQHSVARQHVTWCKDCGKVLPLTRGRCRDCRTGRFVARGILPATPDPEARYPLAVAGR